MYTITLHQLYNLLKEKNLLLAASEKNSSDNRTFTYLSYDSRNIKEETLFFCKGTNFQITSLQQAIDAGVTVYLSETDYQLKATAILVTNIKEAMVTIAQAFYQQPQDQLIKIGITGTKGKTTTAYFIHTILNLAYPEKVALFSSEETTVDGVTFVPSSLTTPESFDLYRQMAQAIRNGLTHLVMEVSSQAYKLKRVTGLTFDIGIFLNISSDHISPLEHEDFEDYFYCKQQLLLNSQQVIYNEEIFTNNELQLEIPMYTYGRKHGMYQIQSVKDSRSFQLQTESKLAVNGYYTLSIFGDFNHENATAAILACSLLGISQSVIREGLNKTYVPGRMNLLEKQNGAYVFVDYAHNYLSVKAIGDFAKSLRPHGQTIFVTGSVGGKALSRRSDIGRALSECADTVILTSDDPDFENPHDIAKEIHSAITNPAVRCHFYENRKQAVKKAIDLAEPNDTVILVGKGTETWLKVRGEKFSYEGDLILAQQFTQNIIL